MKIVKNRPFKRTVTVKLPAEDGVSFNEVTFTGHFVALSRDDLNRLRIDTSEGKHEFLDRTFVGFDGVSDDDGPLPVTPENIAMLISDAFVGPALVQTYIATVSGAARKN